jgi:5-oxoprolinase (ATP-hydrolysing) subunit C
VIRILEAGPLASIQDEGRADGLAFGVSRCGALDLLALRAGNLLVGNEPGAAAIEIFAAPFAVRFETDTVFALTGAHLQPTLDGRRLSPWWALAVRAGQCLQLQPGSGQTHEQGRAYLCLPGGIAVDPVMGSRSTDLKAGFGGLAGRRLKRGDLLKTQALPPSPLPSAYRLPPRGVGLLAPPGDFGHRAGEPVLLRMIPAAEYRWLTDEVCNRFHETLWNIEANSNRQGFRLAGPPLRVEPHGVLRSSAILPGVIQLPPSGQPIVQLSDANTMGGYPKLGVVIEADLRRLAQTGFGASVRFVASDESAAAAARKDQARLLEDWRHAIETVLAQGNRAPAV